MLIVAHTRNSMSAVNFDTDFWYIVSVGLLFYATFMYQIVRFLMQPPNNNSCVSSFFVGAVFTLKIPISVYYILQLWNINNFNAAVDGVPKTVLSIACIIIYSLQVIQWITSPLTNINSGIAIPILTSLALIAILLTFFVSPELIDALTATSLGCTIGAIMLISIPIFLPRSEKD